MNENVDRAARRNKLYARVANKCMTIYLFLFFSFHFARNRATVVVNGDATYVQNNDIIITCWQ